MKTTRSLLKLAFLMAITSLALTAGAQTFFPIDFPGAISTQPVAINPSGSVVGRYISADNNQHGFLLTGGGFTSIDVPNGQQTEVNGIEPSGRMVGDYASADGRTHGFLLDKGRFTTFDYPGASSTYAFGISPSGDVVGIHLKSQADSPHGYLLTKHGDFIAIDFPNSLLTLAAAVIGNTVVGGYLDTALNLHGFRLSGGIFQSIDCPGMNTLFLSGLNPQGDMTGGASNTADGKQHGVLLSAGKCTTIDFPGSVGTNFVNNINPRGDMVGIYESPDHRVRGYLRTKK